MGSSKVLGFVQNIGVLLKLISLQQHHYLNKSITPSHL